MANPWDEQIPVRPATDDSQRIGLMKPALPQILAAITRAKQQNSPQAAQGGGTPMARPAPQAPGAGSQAGVPPQAGQYVGTGFQPREMPQGPGVANGINALLTGVMNSVGQAKEQNSKKQYQQASMLWDQVLNAQLQMQQAKSPEEFQRAKETVETIMSDKKNQKMFEESLSIMFPNQEAKTTPASVAAQHSLKRFGSKLKGAFDPRMAAQRMQGGPGTASVPAMFQNQQPTAEQQARWKIMNDPQNMETAVKREIGLIPSAYQQGELDLHTKEYEAKKAEIASLADHRKQEEAHWALQDQYNQQYKAASIKNMQIRTNIEAMKARAYAAKMQRDAGGAPVSRAAEAYLSKLESGELTEQDLGKIPSKIRNEVMQEATARNVIIQKKLTPDQQRIYDTIMDSKPHLDKAMQAWNNLIQKHPELKSDDGIQGLKNRFKTVDGILKYYARMENKDPDVETLLREGAFLGVQSASKFTRLGRSVQVYKDITKHLPKLEDTVARFGSDLTWLAATNEDQLATIQGYRYSGHVPNAQKPQTGATEPPPPAANNDDIDGTKYLDNPR